jgi:hypothetical protein
MKILKLNLNSLFFPIVFSQNFIIKKVVFKKTLPVKENKIIGCLILFN